MIVAGMTGKIQAIEADCTGSCHDSVALKQSDFFKKMTVDEYRPFEGAMLAADLGYSVSAF